MEVRRRHWWRGWYWAGDHGSAARRRRQRSDRGTQSGTAGRGTGHRHGHHLILGRPRRGTRPRPPRRTPRRQPTAGRCGQQRRHHDDVDLHDRHAMLRVKDELALDLWAPMHLTIALLPVLLSRPEAAVVNVSTGLIYAPFGRTPGYATAKAGVHAFTQALRHQTRHDALQVLEVLPRPLTPTRQRLRGLQDQARSGGHCGGQGLDQRHHRTTPGTGRVPLSDVAPGAERRLLDDEQDGRQRRCTE